MIDRNRGKTGVRGVYRSHTGNSVAKRHYLGQDFTTLADGLTKLRQTLAAMFAADTTAKGQTETVA